MICLQEGEEGGEKKGFLGLGGHKKVTIELLCLMILYIRHRLAMVMHTQVVAA